MMIGQVVFVALWVSLLDPMTVGQEAVTFPTERVADYVEQFHDERQREQIIAELESADPQEIDSIVTSVFVRAGGEIRPPSEPGGYVVYNHEDLWLFFGPSLDADETITAVEQVREYIRALREVFPDSLHDWSVGFVVIDETGHDIADELATLPRVLRDRWVVMSRLHLKELRWIQHQLEEASPADDPALLEELFERLERIEHEQGEGKDTGDPRRRLRLRGNVPATIEQIERIALTLACRYARRGDGSLDLDPTGSSGLLARTRLGARDVSDVAAALAHGFREVGVDDAVAATLLAPLERPITSSAELESALVEVGQRVLVRSDESHLPGETRSGGEPASDEEWRDWAAAADLGDLVAAPPDRGSDVGSPSPRSRQSLLRKWREQPGRAIELLEAVTGEGRRTQVGDAAEARAFAGVLQAFAGRGEASLTPGEVGRFLERGTQDADESRRLTGALCSLVGERAAFEVVADVVCRPGAETVSCEEVKGILARASEVFEVQRKALAVALALGEEGVDAEGMIRRGTTDSTMFVEAMRSLVEDQRGSPPGAAEVDSIVQSVLEEAIAADLAGDSARNSVPASDLGHAFDRLKAAAEALGVPGAAGGATPTSRAELQRREAATAATAARQLGLLGGSLPSNVVTDALARLGQTLGIDPASPGAAIDRAAQAGSTGGLGATPAATSDGGSGGDDQADNGAEGEDGSSGGKAGGGSGGFLPGNAGLFQFLLENLARTLGVEELAKKLLTAMHLLAPDLFTELANAVSRLNDAVVSEDLNDLLNDVNRLLTKFGPLIGDVLDALDTFIEQGSLAVAEELGGRALDEFTKQGLARLSEETGIPVGVLADLYGIPASFDPDAIGEQALEWIEKEGVQLAAQTLGLPPEAIEAFMNGDTSAALEHVRDRVHHEASKFVARELGVDPQLVAAAIDGVTTGETNKLLEEAKKEGSRKLAGALGVSDDMARLLLEGGEGVVKALSDESWRASLSQRLDAGIGPLRDATPEEAIDLVTEFLGQVQEEEFRKLFNEAVDALGADATKEEFWKAYDLVTTAANLAARGAVPDPQVVGALLGRQWEHAARRIAALAGAGDRGVLEHLLSDGLIPADALDFTADPAALERVLQDWSNSFIQAGGAQLDWLPDDVRRTIARNGLDAAAGAVDAWCRDLLQRGLLDAGVDPRLVDALVDEDAAAVGRVVHSRLLESVCESLGLDPSQFSQLEELLDQDDWLIRLVGDLEVPAIADRVGLPEDLVSTMLSGDNSAMDLEEVRHVVDVWRRSESWDERALRAGGLDPVDLVRFAQGTSITSALRADIVRHARGQLGGEVRSEIGEALRKQGVLEARIRELLGAYGPSR